MQWPNFGQQDVQMDRSKKNVELFMINFSGLGPVPGKADSDQVTFENMYVSKKEFIFFQKETWLAHRGGRGNCLRRRFLHEWRWTSLVELAARLFLFLLSMSKDATSVLFFGECIQKRCELLKNLLLSIGQIIWENKTRNHIYSTKLKALYWRGWHFTFKSEIHLNGWEREASQLRAMK